MPEGDGVELGASEALVVCELEESHGGIGSGGQHEDQRSAAVGVLKTLRQIKRRRLDKLLAQFLHHKVSDGRDDLQKYIYIYI